MTRRRSVRNRRNVSKSISFQTTKIENNENINNDNIFSKKEVKKGVARFLLLTAIGEVGLSVATLSGLIVLDVGVPVGFSVLLGLAGLKTILASRLLKKSKIVTNKEGKLQTFSKKEAFNVSKKINGIVLKTKEGKHIVIKNDKIKQFIEARSKPFRQISVRG